MTVRNIIIGTDFRPKRIVKLRGQAICAKEFTIFKFFKSFKAFIFEDYICLHMIIFLLRLLKKINVFSLKNGWIRLLGGFRLLGFVELFPLRIGNWLDV